MKLAIATALTCLSLVLSAAASPSHSSPRHLTPHARRALPDRLPGLQHRGRAAGLNASHAIVKRAKRCKAKTTSVSTKAAPTSSVHTSTKAVVVAPTTTVGKPTSVAAATPTVAPANPASAAPKPTTTVVKAAPSPSSSPAAAPSSPASSGGSGSTNSGSSSSSSGSTSSSDISAYLSAHNTVRSQHGASALTWSDDLAAAAAKWADNCQFKHSGGTLGPYGENLSAGSGDYSIASAVKAWTDEESEYDASNPQASHYTQVVWKGSKQVGCAVVSCNLDVFTSNFWPAKFYVCEYSPQGNIIGQFAANVQ